MSTPPALSRPTLTVLDFDAITGLSTGSPITTVPDTKNGRGATQPTASRRPTYTASSPNFNGHATGTYDLDDHSDQTVALATPVNSRTHVLVARISSTANVVFQTGTTGTTECRLYYSTNSATTTSAFADGGRIDFGSRLTSPQVLFAFFTTGSNPNQFARQNNGAKVSIGTDSTTDRYDMLRLGAASDLSSFASMEVALAVVYDGALTDADMNTFYSWAGTTYGIGGAAPAPNVAPTANAGPDQTVETGKTVLLDFSGSRDDDGTITAYTATLSKPAGSTAALAGSGSSRTFVPDLVGSYTVSLTVTDNAATPLTSAADTAVITAVAPAAALPFYVYGLDGVRRLSTINYLPAQPGAPVLASPATNRTATGFTSSWAAAPVKAGGVAATDYLVQRKTGAGAWTTVATVTTTSFTHSGLTASTSYDVRIIARDGAVEGKPSNTVTTATTA